MTVLWQCSCGSNFGENAHAAFLHRKGDAHQVTPVLIAREAEKLPVIHSFYRPQAPALMARVSHG